MQCDEAFFSRAAEGIWLASHLEDLARLLLVRHLPPLGLEQGEKEVPPYCNSDTSQTAAEKPTRVVPEVTPKNIFS